MRMQKKLRGIRLNDPQSDLLTSAFINIALEGIDPTTENSLPENAILILYCLWYRRRSIMSAYDEPLSKTNC
jgi:hypothetical protein